MAAVNAKKLSGRPDPAAAALADLRPHQRPHDAGLRPKLRIIESRPVTLGPFGAISGEGEVDRTCVRLRYILVTQAIALLLMGVRLVTTTSDPAAIF